MLVLVLVLVLEVILHSNLASLVRKLPRTSSINDWHRRNSNSQRVRVPFH